MHLFHPLCLIASCFFRLMFYSDWSITKRKNASHYKTAVWDDINLLASGMVARPGH